MTTIAAVRAWLKRVAEKHIVAQCPPELAACQDCNVTSCTQAQWEACEARRCAAGEVTVEHHR